ncbi:hypothetical protein CERZMDRAFT_84354 [Cercospora zeae-maydis SCOH1-5]|uniref:Uncharacterized protein n=1 Tax=Cercospora zeae-maydis SCOH1-5 TaxID=717836 RepID=A0A6A6FH58_9PEZI|nr:hypothetical protein CERZMDRAFT_84354 [Cercospora zeae-maydis SCOH1-5]
MTSPLQDSGTGPFPLAEAPGLVANREEQPRSPASNPCWTLADATPSTSEPANAAPDSRYRPQPVLDVAKYKAFPPAARKREIDRAVRSFTGNAQNVFVHYVEPVLQERRRELLAKKTKKLYHKTAAQFWSFVSQEQAFFWRQKAVELRLALRQGTLKAELCLADAGYRDEWYEYRRFAEVAVAEYFQQEVPGEFREERGEDGKDQIAVEGVVPGCVDNSAAGTAQMTEHDQTEVENVDDEADVQMPSSATSTDAQDDLPRLPDALAELGIKNLPC